MRVQHASSQWNSYHVVTRGPPKVLHHFPVGGFAKIYQPQDIGGFAVGQDNIGGLSGYVSARTDYNAHIG